MRARETKRARRQRALRSFTLIELLLVMGIIGLLLVMAVGAYQSVGRASQVDVSLTQLKFTMQLARQWAISQRQTTWVVFPRGAPNNRVQHGAMEVATNVNYRAYGVYSQMRSGGDVEMVREWSYLPAGVFFDPNPFSSGVSQKNLLELTGFRKSDWPSDYSDLNHQPAIAFVSRGSLSNQSTDPEIYIAEGFVAPPATEPVFTNVGTVTNALQVYRFTGLTQITRYGEDD